MVRMRMIPANDFESTFLGGAVGVANVVGRDRETIARRVVASIDEFVKRADFAGIFGVDAEDGATAFVGEGFRAVSADFVDEIFGDGDGFHFLLSRLIKICFRAKNPFKGCQFNVAAEAATHNA